MNLERFEELLTAEMDGDLTPEEARELDLACAEHSGLQRLRLRNRRLNAMITALTPNLAPESFVADTMHRIELEMQGAREGKPAPSTPEMASSERRRAEDRRAVFSEPERDPWWLGFFASPFFKWTSAMAVMAVLIYMGTVVVRRNGVVFPSGGSRNTPIVAEEATSRPETTNQKTDHPSREMEVASVPDAAASPLPAPDHAPLEREAVRVADAGSEPPEAAASEPEPIPSPQPSAAPEAVKKPIEVAVAEAAPPEENLPTAAGSDSREPDQSDQSSEAVESLKKPSESMPEPPDRTITEAVRPEPMLPTPAPARTPLPAVELPRARPLQDRAVAGADQVSQREAGASPATQPPGMEKVFGEIRRDLGTEDVNGGGTTASGQRIPDVAIMPAPKTEERVVTNPDDLRKALAQEQAPPALREQSLTAAAPSMPPVPQLPVTQAPPPARVVTGANELRTALEEARRNPTIGSGAIPPRTERAAVPALAPPQQPPASVSTPTQIGIQLAEAQPTNPAPTVREGDNPYQRSFANSPTRSAPAAQSISVQEIERAVARNGGRVLRRGPDPRNPSLTRISCRMDSGQLAAFVKDLERLGIQRSGQSGSAWRETPVPREAAAKSSFYVLERGQLPTGSRAEAAPANKEIELVVMNSR